MVILQWRTGHLHKQTKCFLISKKVHFKFKIVQTGLDERIIAAREFLSVNLSSVISHDHLYLRFLSLHAIAGRSYGATVEGTPFGTDATYTSVRTIFIDSFHTLFHTLFQFSRLQVQCKGGSSFLGGVRVTRRIAAWTQDSPRTEQM